MTTVEMQGPLTDEGTHDAGRPAPDVDLSVHGAAERELAALADENRALRAYLGRVLEVLDARVEEAEAAAAPAPTVPLAEAVEPVRMADLERRLRRAEETIDDVLWLLDRYDVPATTTAD